MYKDELLSKIAYLYYLENKTQAEIANELGIYRTSISRLLKQARQQGIVKIEISDFDPTIMALERKLKQLFPLKEVQVTAIDPLLSSSQKDQKLAESAASFLKYHFKSGQTIGLSWGSTLGLTIAALEPKKLNHVQVVPLVGGPGYIDTQFHVNTLVYELSKKLNGTGTFINASIIEESPQTKEAILQSKYFVPLHQAWQQIDLAFVTVGSGLTEKSQWRDLLTVKDVEDLKLREAVGECCGRFYDSTGKALNSPVNERTIGLTLAELAKIPTTIAIVRSKQKVHSLLPLLNSGTFNTLLTDQETATELIKRAEQMRSAHKI